MADSALQATDIVGGYGKAVVVQGVSVRLGRKELVALVGPNGSGKSTLLKSIYGLASLFSGTVSWDGRDITRVGPEEKARLGIGYVPQVDNVFPDLRVRENLEMCSYFRRDKAEVRSDLDGVFRVFPVLNERKAQMASTLSGGERQMLAIGRALMARPRTPLLGPPTAAPPPPGGAELLLPIR